MPEYDFQELSVYPTRCGVYLMKDRAGGVIYVGKAKNLRVRLRNYFSGADTRLNVRFLMKRIAEIETIVTQNEKEAFLLENTLIKKHKPRYNVMLRDDKTYFSIRLDETAEWPRLELVRRRGWKKSERGRKKGDRSRYFGPFTSSRAVRQTINQLLRIFPLRSCKDSELRNRTRPCILYEVGKCCAPCVKDIDRAEYAELVRQVILFLEGRGDELTTQLKERMARFAEQLQFEKAAELRDKIQAVAQTRETQLTASHRGDDHDAIALATGDGVHAMVAQHYRGGLLCGSEKFKFRDVGQEEGQLLGEFVARFYDGAHTIPAEVLLSVEVESAQLLEEHLRELREGAVRVHTPQRGRLRKIVELARRNAEEHLRAVIEGERDAERALNEVQAKLKLARRPEVIECVDISNIQGTLAVGSLVRFVGGVAHKASYRRYKIATVEGADDYAMMREVLIRRYGRLLREGGLLPELLIVDGGKGQLNVAIDVMRALGITSIALSGLAKSRLKEEPGKDEKRRTDERLFLPNRKNPVVFKAGAPALHLVQRIRDEAHRFAITYHRKIRSQANLRSILDEIPGIGPKRRKGLLRSFGSLAGVRGATVEELAAVEGISPALAADLYAFLHPPEGAPAAE